MSVMLNSKEVYIAPSSLVRGGLGLVITYQGGSKPEPQDYAWIRNWILKPHNLVVGHQLQKAR